MDLMKFKDFKKDKIERKLAFQKFKNSMVVGVEHLDDIRKQNPDALKYNDKSTLLGFLDKDDNDDAIGYMLNNRDGTKKKVIPVVLQHNKKEDLSYIKYMFPSSRIHETLCKVLVNLPYTLLFDTEWKIMVKFKTKKDAIAFLLKNQDYGKLRNSALREFTIRDAVNSNDKEFFKKDLVFYIYE